MKKTKRPRHVSEQGNKESNMREIIASIQNEYILKIKNLNKELETLYGDRLVQLVLSEKI